MTAARFGELYMMEDAELKGLGLKYGFPGTINSERGLVAAFVLGAESAQTPIPFEGGHVAVRPVGGSPGLMVVEINFTDGLTWVTNTEWIVLMGLLLTLFEDLWHSTLKTETLQGLGFCEVDHG